MAEHTTPRLEMRGLLFVFWGYLFILFDVRVGGFDLLPDIIGFLLITNGLTTLKKYTLAFAVAQKYAIVMALLSVADILSMSMDAVLAILLALFQTGFCIVIARNICLGISQLAQNVGMAELKTKAETRSAVYTVVTAASGVLLIMGVLLPTLASVLTIPTALCGVAASVLLMALFWQTQKQLDGLEYFPIEKTEGSL